MERHLQKNLRKDIKHIISMQTLLEQYDRQNKYLNKQVLLLLDQNTKLRMDKVKVNILNDIFKPDTKLKSPLKSQNRVGVKENSKWRGGQVGKGLERRSSKKIISKIIKESNQQSSHPQLGKSNDKPITIRVQEHILVNAVATQVPIKKQQNVFSFRNGPNPPELKGRTEVNKQSIDRPNVAVGQISKQASPIHTPLASNISATSINLQKQQSLRKQKSMSELKRSHAIKPSPQIILGGGGSKGMLTPSGSDKRLQSKQLWRVKMESVERKKRFIEVMTSLTPLKIKSRNDDLCC